MPVLPEEVKLYRSIFVNDEGTNGGRMSPILIVSGVKNNIFPDVPDSERVSGSTKYRKVFWKIENPNNTPFEDVHIFMTRPTNGGDWVTFFAGTQIDKQMDITGTERQYGCGILSVDANASDTQIQIQVEDESLNNIIQTGDTIWIGDGTHEEFHENVTATPNGNNITIQLQAGDQLLYSYSSSNTVVSSCLVVSIVVVQYSDVSLSTTAGTFDDTQIQLDAIGTVEDTWTITFTSDTEFTCEGAEEGDVGNGNINEDFAPENPDFPGSHYFTIPSSAWGGTWAENDTVVFKTHPASVPIWFKRVIPPGIGTVYDIFAHAISGRST